MSAVATDGLGALRNGMTASEYGRAIGISTREALDSLNAWHADGLIRRQVGDPSLPAHQEDRSPARWYLAVAEGSG